MQGGTALGECQGCHGLYSSKISSIDQDLLFSSKFFVFVFQERPNDFQPDAIEKIKEFMVEQSSRTVEDRFNWEDGDATLPIGWKMRCSIVSSIWLTQNNTQT